MCLEQDSESERLGALSLPDIFPLSLPSMISSSHATEKNLRTKPYLFVSIYIYLGMGIPMEGDILLRSFLKTKTNKKQKTQRFVKGALGCFWGRG